jgi:hypothetical protein
MFAPGNAAIMAWYPANCDTFHDPLVRVASVVHGGGRDAIEKALGAHLVEVWRIIRTVQTEVLE